MGTITDKQMNSKPGKSVWLTEDAPRGCGRFMARILKSGDRLFYFRYTNSQGERVFLPVGNYDQSGKDGLTLREARTKAGELSRLYQAGIRDLREYQEAEEDARKATHEAEMARLRVEREAAEAEKARQAARKKVKELFEHWADIDLKNRKDGGVEVRRLFEKDVLPKIGQLAVEDVKKGHVIEVVDAQLNRGVTRMAKLTLVRTDTSLDDKAVAEALRQAIDPRLHPVQPLYVDRNKKAAPVLEYASAAMAQVAWVHLNAFAGTPAKPRAYGPKRVPAVFWPTESPPGS